MPEFRTTRQLPHSAENMFDLVADMDIGYKLIRERVTSRVTLDRRLLHIRADYLEGPFRSMGGARPPASQASIAKASASISMNWRPMAPAIL